MRSGDRELVLTSDVPVLARGYCLQYRAERGTRTPGSGQGMRRGGDHGMKKFLRRLWYSPALFLVLVFVLGAPRKIPRH